MTIADCLLLLANLAILAMNIKLYTECQKLRVLRKEELPKAKR